MHPLTRFINNQNYITFGLPGGSDSKESARSAGGPGSIAGSGRYPGEGSITLLPNPLKMYLLFSLQNYFKALAIYHVISSHLFHMCL